MIVFKFIDQLRENWHSFNNTFIVCLQCAGSVLYTVMNKADQKSMPFQSLHCGEERWTINEIGKYNIQDDMYYGKKEEGAQ